MVTNDNCNTIIQNTLAGARTRGRLGRREEAPAQGMHQVPGEHPETAPWETEVGSFQPTRFNA